jgi:glycosyltransferase involved in cell wall biosynthesis
MDASKPNIRVREVIHVVARYPPALGGMEQAAHWLAQTQHEIGIRVTVFTSDDESKKVQVQGDAPFPVFRLKSFNVAHTPIIPSLLFRLLRLSSSAPIHVHISPAYTPEIAWIYARLRGCPYVAHMHIDLLPSGKAGFLLEPYKKVLLRRILRDASAVVVPTDDYRDIIGEKYTIAHEQIRVIPNGNAHRVSGQPKSLSQRRGRRKLLFVGRLSPQKNIPLLLEAIAAYVDKYTNDIELDIVGDGPERCIIESEIQRLKLSHIVFLQGPMFGDALESKYEASDLFILTSINESFGIVLVEAMSKALPIVSVNIPAVRNIVHHGVNGLLADQNATALADVIRTLITDKGLYSKISNNNLAKSRVYDWKNIAEQFGLVYDSVLRLNEH